MIKHWKTKSGLALAILTLAIWQLHPTFAKDGAYHFDDSADKDWGHSLSVHIQKRLFTAIDATKDQQDQLSGLFNEAYQQNQGLRSQMKQKTLAVIEAFSDDSTSNDQLKQQVAELRSVREKLMDARLETALKARAMLTDKQKKLLTQRVKTRFDWWLKAE